MTESKQSHRVPQLIAFDLDYTLWDFWIDTHVAGPLNLQGSVVKDSNGRNIEFYPDVPQILNQICAFEGTQIAVCSRTSASALAWEALSLIQVPYFANSKEGHSGGSLHAASFFDQVEIYPGSKIAHFKQIHHNTGIPYSEMVFYDDESRNREVESLGDKIQFLCVTFILVPNGLDARIFGQGLNEWQRRCLNTESV